MALVTICHDGRVILPLVWLILGVVLVATEVLSGDFVLLMLGVSGLLAAGAAALGAGIVISVVVFAVLSVGLVVGARPELKKRLYRATPTKTNVEALIGTEAVAVTGVTAEGGQVKIGGDVWSAKSFVDDEDIEAGAAVTVMEISGATAIVMAKPFNGG